MLLPFARHSLLLGREMMSMSDYRDSRTNANDEWFQVRGAVRPGAVVVPFAYASPVCGA